ncbi:citrate synthase-lysine N-methyltransferase CSKMT, mitochondrial [Chiloscyllium plagiosum]|uniref:citrate synthase-lysine N-methyltransferase CSKMT, mitochondrial n=1 Tax=Chiloscyllium plagiosum TaxID=36176 RepID=UPI001CB86C12|nr:citrate synthase-lysine N-methyltransferase CSKMT, mitochondrial [Chiloscyllium plagiosum]
MTGSPVKYGRKVIVPKSIGQEDFSILSKCQCRSDGLNGLLKVSGLCVSENSVSIVLADYLFTDLQKQTTWDTIYQRSQGQPFQYFDWFLGYSSLRGLILQLLQDMESEAPLKLLDIGCGTSELGPRLYCECPFPLHVYCVDFSPIALAIMRAQFSLLPLPVSPASQLHFVQMDIGNLSGFQQQSFDLILDKGTLDALLRADDGGEAARCALTQSLGMLRPGGSMLQISDEDPDVRIVWLESLCLATVTALEVDTEKNAGYFAYIIKPTSMSTWR